MTSAPRQHWLDPLRALAALAVTLHHLDCVFPATPDDPLREIWSRLLDHGHLGVPVFFVISGYCIFQTWLRSPSPAPFVARRARRIYPAYFASLAVVLAVAVITRLVSGVNDVTPLPSSPAAIAATLALATTPVTHVEIINWVYWTLPYELAFYLVCAALLFLRAPRTRLLALAAIHALLCLAAAFAVAPKTGPAFFVPLWPLFGAGAALATLPAHPRLAFAMLAFAAVPALAGRISPAYVVAALATLASIRLTTRLPLPAALAPLGRLGLFSYSLYLVHVPLGVYGAQRILVQAFPSVAGLAFIALQLISLALVIALAYAFHLLAEKPFFATPSVSPP